MKTTNCHDCGKDITKTSGSKRWDNYNKSLFGIKKKDKWLCASCNESYVVGSFFIPSSVLNECNKI